MQCITIFPFQRIVAIQISKDEFIKLLMKSRKQIKYLYLKVIKIKSIIFKYEKTSYPINGLNTSVYKGFSSEWRCISHYKWENMTENRQILLFKVHFETFINAINMIFVAKSHLIMHVFLFKQIKLALIALVARKIENKHKTFVSLIDACVKNFLR